MRVGMGSRVTSSDHGDGGHAQCSPLPLSPFPPWRFYGRRRWARDGKGPGVSPGPALREGSVGRASYSLLAAQLPLCLLPRGPSGVALPPGLPVLLGACLAPGLTRYGLGAAVTAQAEPLGDLALLSPVLTVVCHPFGCPISGPLVFLPLFGRLRGPWLVVFLGPRVRCSSVSKCIL